MDITTVQVEKTNWVVLVQIGKQTIIEYFPIKQLIFLGCNNETFSCGDWDNVLHRSSCFERKNRCDRVKNCPNGRDEDECTLLSRHLENPNQVSFDFACKWK